MRVQIIYKDRDFLVGSILFDYKELIQQAYSITNDSSISKVFANSILEFANDLRFNYGFFEIDKGVPQFNLLTDTVIDCVPKKEEIFGSDTTNKQYKDFIHMVNNQVTKLVQLICYNINVMDDGR